MKAAWNTFQNKKTDSDGRPKVELVFGQRAGPLDSTVWNHKRKCHLPCAKDGILSVQRQFCLFFTGIHTCDR